LNLREEEKPLGREGTVQKRLKRYFLVMMLYENEVARGKHKHIY